MRYALLLLLLPVFASMGCSVMVAEAGTRSSEYETQEKAHKLFGKPIAAGTDDGQSFEEFYTRRFFPAGSQTMTEAIWFLHTLGLSEFYFLPVELVRVARETALGQTIRLTYNADGSVRMVDAALGTPKRQQAGNEGTNPSEQK